MYGKIYAYCQTLDIPIKTKLVKVMACELAQAPGVKLFCDHALDPEKVRGYFVKADNPDHPFSKQADGYAVIVFAKELNECWKRFVIFKELMHLFDNKLAWVSSSEELSTLLNEFTANSPTPSPAMVSENVCVWMALGIMCPEEKRIEYARRRNAAEISDMEIALALKMPVQFVPNLFSPVYKAIISNFIKA